ncbi:MAG TPA: glycosyltransferase family 1 protein [Chloroflexi bacterium]|nr:glycosyltransferase family 1 protein [Chloroflexota bacterium]
MHIAFINPQGNFDPQDRYWTEHPDFGGQLVYVKEVSLALGRMGHQVDILTRRIVDPEWPGFEETLDAYPGEKNVRIVRLPCGGDRFLRKEELWPYLGSEWVPNILKFYAEEKGIPEAATAHYGDGALSGALLKREMNIPYTMTGHSLGAQKMDKLGVTRDNLAAIDARFHFARRIVAERVGMNHASRIITSTTQERMEQYGHPAYRGAVDTRDDERFTVVPPGVNLRIFSPDLGADDVKVQRRIKAAMIRDIAQVRRQLPLVIASSRLDAKKNHVGLVRAFIHNQDLRARANLAIVVRGLQDPLHRYDALSVGEKAIMDEITELMAAHNLWGKIVAFPLDSQAELAAAYRYLAQRRSVFALTALYEPFGLAPLEAMSCGLPAVVTKNGGPSESMWEGAQEFGVLVDPADPDDVARGLLRVIKSERVWNYFHRAGMERVLSRYTWERTAEGYLRVIESLLAGKGHTGDLEIPAYFFQPDQDISLSDLEALYFEAV